MNAHSVSDLRAPATTPRSGDLDSRQSLVPLVLQLPAYSLASFFPERCSADDGATCVKCANEIGHMLKHSTDGLMPAMEAATVLLPRFVSKAPLNLPSGGSPQK